MSIGNESQRKLELQIEEHERYLQKMEMAKSHE
ncbi:hypothetical protein AMTRI_Chr10g227730 [Amborella trichopoda]